LKRLFAPNLRCEQSSLLKAQTGEAVLHLAGDKERIKKRLSTFTASNLISRPALNLDTGGREELPHPVTKPGLPDGMFPNQKSKFG
jgi:hypothetical protein